jgi:hypothetical protein
MQHDIIERVRNELGSEAAKRAEGMLKRRVAG